MAPSPAADCRHERRGPGPGRSGSASSGANSARHSGQHQDRRDDEASHGLAVLWPELAGNDTSAVQTGNQRQAAVGNRGLVEAGERRELVQFADQQARQHHKPPVADDRRHMRHHLPQQGRYRTGMCGGDRLGPVEIGHDQRAHQRLEYRLLAREIEVERAFGSACACCDVFHPRGGETLLGKNIERRIEQLGGARILAAAWQLAHDHTITDWSVIIKCYPNSASRESRYWLACCNS